MDNKTDYTNIAAVVADELLSIGAVFLSLDKLVHMGKRN